MLIRPMTQEDFDAFLELDKKIFPDEEPWLVNHFTLYFDPKLCFVSYDVESGQLNGYIIAKRFGNNIYISNLGVYPSGQRIGPALMEKVIVTAQENHKSAQDITLQVRPDNTHAIRFYQRYGFNDSNEYAQIGFKMMRRPLFCPLGSNLVEQNRDLPNTKLLSDENRPDIAAVKREITRLRKNQKSFFGIGNGKKADAIESALNKSQCEDVRRDDNVIAALAKHRLCGFFGRKPTTALINVLVNYSATV